MSTVYTASPMTGPRFGHAWRDKAGAPHSTVQLSGDTYLDFGDPEAARELAAVLLTAANAMQALPPAEGGQQ